MRERTFFRGIVFRSLTVAVRIMFFNRLLATLLIANDFVLVAEPRRKPSFEEYNTKHLGVAVATLVMTMSVSTRADDSADSNGADIVKTEFVFTTASFPFRPTANSGALSWKAKVVGRQYVWSDLSLRKRPPSTFA